MRVASLEAIVRALNEAEVSFILVGGLAVVTHGFGRSTEDVDLVVNLDAEQIVRAFAALARIGYQPRVPITVEQFADPAQRESWIRDKGMLVLSFQSDEHRETPLDVFVKEPFDFGEEYGKAFVDELAPGLAVRVLRLPALLEMKRSAGRPRDLADIDELNLLHGKPSSYDA